MTSLAPLRSRIADAAAAITQPLPGLAAVACSDVVELLSNDELIALVDRSRVLQDALDAYKLALAGGLAERSNPERGAASLARMAGHATPARLVGDLLGVSVGDATRLVKVAEATRERHTLTGEALPARYPLVQAALQRGDMSIEAANIITSSLEQARPRAEHDDICKGEQALVGATGELDLLSLRKAADRVRHMIDHDGPEPTDRERRSKRMLVIRPLRDGMTRIEWELPPEDAAIVVPAIEAVCRQFNFDTNRSGFRDSAENAATSDADVRFETPLQDPHGNAVEPGAGPVRYTLEGRPETEMARRFAQNRSDAVVEIFRHSARCTCEGRKSLPTFHAVVRIDLDDLRSELDAHTGSCGDTGAGHATAALDGIEANVSAGMARRMAAAAGIIPAVMGGDSLPLDLGRTQRHFSTAQRTALIERDGGCAAPGCMATPAWGDAHHIGSWASGGPTNLANGVMLCTSHHHRVHDNGWQIRIEAEDPAHPNSRQVPWFYPPNEWVRLDPKHRTRIRGGQRTLTLAA